jgi:hypothetical protein
VDGVATTAPLYSPAGPACTSTVTWALACPPAGRVSWAGATVAMAAGAGRPSSPSSSTRRSTVTAWLPRLSRGSDRVTGWTPVWG